MPASWKLILAAQLHTASASLPEATLPCAIPGVPATVTGTKVTKATKVTTTCNSTSIMDNDGTSRDWRDIMKIAIMKR